MLEVVDRTVQGAAEAGLQSWRLGPMAFVKADHYAAQAGLVADLLPPDSPDYVKVVLQLDGEVRVEKNGRIAILLPETWGVYGLSKSCNVFHIDPASKQLIVVIPRGELISRNPAIARIMQRQFSPDNPTCALAFHFLRSLYESGGDKRVLRGELANVAIHLLQVALSDQASHAGARADRAQFRSRVTSYVDLHLHDPELSVERVARALHCSSRYVQKMFGDAEGLGRYIWRTRLDRCRAAMCDPANARLSITEIAFSFGFSNASHFSRAFRGRYAATPSEYRAGALEAAPLRKSG